jgi:hypothetical protein
VSSHEQFYCTTCMRSGQKINLQSICNQLFSTLVRTVPVELYSIPPQLRHLYHGVSYSLPVDRSPYLMLSAIASQPFRPHHHIDSFGSTLITNYPDIITISVGFSYEIIHHVNLFSDQLLCFNIFFGFCILQELLHAQEGLCSMHFNLWLFL